MAGAGDLDDAAPAYGPEEARDRVWPEDRALGAADEQGGAADPGERAPQGLEVGRSRGHAGIELVAPAAVWPFAHGVPEPLADVLQRPARVERMRALDGLVERRELLYRELRRDRAP